VIIKAAKERMARERVEHMAVSELREAGVTPHDPAARSFSPAYVKYVIFVLTVINLLNAVDRLLPGILAEPIRNELHLADWQIGLMTGLAFSVLMAFLGLPIARLADKHHRPFIIGTTLAIWSGFTALSGLARSFLEICLCRVGVGIGEAGCAPPAHSLITDYTTKERRASALAFHSMGVPLGSLLGFPIGGLVADQFGWRFAFMLVGLPGLLVALLALTTIREPRSRLSALQTAQAQRSSMKETLSVLAKKRTFWLVASGTTLRFFVGAGISSFLASFFLRNHAQELASIAAGFGLKSLGFLGIAIGLLAGAVGSISTCFGGWAADWAAKKDSRNTFVPASIAMFLQAPFLIIALLAQGTWAAIWLLTLPYLMTNFFYGPAYANTQSIVPPQMRATASALLILIVNLVGTGLGPLCIGVLSDYFSRAMQMGSAEGLRWSLIVWCLLDIPCALLYFLTRRAITKDVVS
jgi:MFS family permease